MRVAQSTEFKVKVAQQLEKMNRESEKREYEPEQKGNRH